jgi:hypothetical protein
MAAPGLKAFEARDAKRTGIYTSEQERPGLSAIDKKRFMKNARAWKFFANQPPGYQRVAASGYRGPNEKRPACVVLQGLSRIPKADGG